MPEPGAGRLISFHVSMSKLVCEEKSVETRREIFKIKSEKKERREKRINERIGELWHAAEEI